MADRAFQVNVTSTSNRANWEFVYKAGDLAKAAKEQRDYRLSRIKTWTKSKEGIIKKIRKSGLRMNESVAEKMINYTSNVSNRRGVEISIDPKLQQDLDECENKIKEHTIAKSAYDAWIQVLSANPRADLKLKHDDWMFFFGR
jgi:hypothetical protein